MQNLIQNTHYDIWEIKQISIQTSFLSFIFLYSQKSDFTV